MFITIFTLLNRVWLWCMIKYCSSAWKKCCFFASFFRNISKTAENIFKKKKKKNERNHGVLVYKKAPISEHCKNYILRDINYFLLKWIKRERIFKFRFKKTILKIILDIKIKKKKKKKWLVKNFGRIWNLKIHYARVFRIISRLWEIVITNTPEIYMYKYLYYIVGISENLASGNLKI